MQYLNTSSSDAELLQYLGECILISNKTHIFVVVLHLKVQYLDESIVCVCACVDEQHP